MNEDCEGIRPQHFLSLFIFPDFNGPLINPGSLEAVAVVSS